jgi:hypothetical protein
MPVEELDVGEQVLVQVPPADQRPADRADREDDEREQEEDQCAQRPAGEALEPRGPPGDSSACPGQA